MSFLLSETHWEMCKQEEPDGEIEAGPQFLKLWSLGTRNYLWAPVTKRELSASCV